MPYELQVDLGAVRFVLSQKNGDRMKLMRWMEHLTDAPFSAGQLTTQDSTGRQIEVSSADNFLIYHWTDHAVKTVRVVRIEKNA